MSETRSCQPSANLFSGCLTTADGVLFSHPFSSSLHENAVCGELAGVDEAGRGPLAGPVVAAAVILDPDNPVEGLDDSKKLTEMQRDQLAPIIVEKALAVAVAEASVEEIDTINILQASMLAMQRAAAALGVTPRGFLIDGNRTPFLPAPSLAVVKGDQRVPAISAASILAKVHRDDLMRQMAVAHPHYGFDRHKGYPTRMHLEALEHHGLLPEHRRSYGPVQRILEGEVTA